ncbi:hypothetical protein [Klebsiella michiganensis]|uniref:hypothetical protein n=1 Tax=Klebsiella michiganensis TaxID=1134687 RepID=UPI0018C6829C|nr:hypothetical protein [Klebsiella michiganensis]MBG2548263.1 hypothetical protein [Klebsiella michiganensis]HEJ8217395.1 hypothetical protein [Klebsiella michiganensis]
MTNNQLTDERIEQIAVWLATESHSLNLEMLTCLRELQERRKAESEPVYQCEFTHADASGELQWHWEDVNEAFYEQYGSGPRGQRRILYSVPQPTPQPRPVMESEPVAEVLSSRPGNDTSTIDRALPVGTPLYRHAQPAPVAQCVPLGDSPYDVPHSMPSNLRELIAEEIGILFSDDDVQSVWDVCRHAAMLQAGNSPVIPDGYVMVPKEPTVNQWAAGMQAFDSGVDKVTRVYKAMLAAAPQEVK